MGGGIANSSSLSSGASGLPERGVFFPGESTTSFGQDTQSQSLLDPESSPYLFAQLRTFDVPSGEARRPPKPAQEPEHGIYPKNKDNFSNIKGPSGLFPLGWKVDKPGPDMATEEPTPPSNHTPTGLTPSESHNASSATSYSSHQDEARNSITNDQSAKNSNLFSFPYARQSPNSTYQTTSTRQDDSSNPSYNMRPNQTSNSDSFTIPPGWDFGTGNTPLPTGSTPLPSEMSPPADGNWSQLLGSMSWSAGGPEQGNINWEANSRAAPQYGYKSGFFVNTDNLDSDGRAR